MARLLRFGVGLMVLLLGAADCAQAQSPPSREQFRDQVDLLFAQARYPELIALCDATVSSQPGAIDPYLVRGVVYLYQEDYVRAAAEAEKVFALSPEDPDAYVLRATAWEEQNLRPESVKRDRRRAVEICTVRLRQNPQDWEILGTRAQAYVDLRQYAEAIKDYDAALALQPGRACLYNDRGVAYHGAGDMEQALRDFDEALRREPRAAMSHRNRGATYEEQGKTEAALFEYGQALQVNPDFVLVLEDRGNLYLREGRYGEAVADAEHALAVASPTQSAAFYALRGRARLELAREDLERAARLDPEGAAGASARSALQMHRLFPAAPPTPPPLLPAPPPPRPATYEGVEEAAYPLPPPAPDLHTRERAQLHRERLGARRLPDGAGTGLRVAGGGGGLVGRREDHRHVCARSGDTPREEVRGASGDPLQRGELHAPGCATPGPERCHLRSPAGRGREAGLDGAAGGEDYRGHARRSVVRAVTGYRAARALISR